MLTRRTIVASWLGLLGLVGCGGGGSGTPPQLEQGSSFVISGIAAKGLLANAIVTAHAIKDDGSEGPQIAQTQTASVDSTSPGSYQVSIPGAYKDKPVLLRVKPQAGTVMQDETISTGKSYVDVAPDFKLSAVTHKASEESPVHITQFSLMAVEAIAQGDARFTTEAIQNVNTYIAENIAGADFLRVKPVGRTEAESLPADDPRAVLFVSQTSVMHAAKQDSSCGNQVAAQVACFVSKLAKSLKAVDAQGNLAFGEKSAQNALASFVDAKETVLSSAELNPTKLTKGSADLAFRGLLQRREQLREGGASQTEVLAGVKPSDLDELTLAKNFIGELRGLYKGYEARLDDDRLRLVANKLETSYESGGLGESWDAAQQILPALARGMEMLADPRKFRENAYPANGGPAYWYRANFGDAPYSNYGDWVVPGRGVLAPPKPSGSFAGEGVCRVAQFMDSNRTTDDPLFARLSYLPHGPADGINQPLNSSVDFDAAPAIAVGCWTPYSRPRLTNRPACSVNGASSPYYASEAYHLRITRGSDGRYRLGVIKFRRLLSFGCPSEPIQAIAVPDATLRWEAPDFNGTAGSDLTRLTFVGMITPGVAIGDRTRFGFEIPRLPGFGYSAPSFETVGSTLLMDGKLEVDIERISQTLARGTAKFEAGVSVVSSSTPSSVGTLTRLTNGRAASPLVVCPTAPSSACLTAGDSAQVGALSLASASILVVSGDTRIEGSLSAESKAAVEVGTRFLLGPITSVTPQTSNPYVSTIAVAGQPLAIFGASTPLRVGDWVSARLMGFSYSGIPSAESVSLSSQQDRIIVNGVARNVTGSSFKVGDLMVNYDPSKVVTSGAPFSDGRRVLVISRDSVLSNDAPKLSAESVTVLEKGTSSAKWVLSGSISTKLDAQTPLVFVGSVEKTPSVFLAGKRVDSGTFDGSLTVGNLPPIGLNLQLTATTYDNVDRDGFIKEEFIRLRLKKMDLSSVIDATLNSRRRAAPTPGKPYEESSITIKNHNGAQISGSTKQASYNVIGLDGKVLGIIERKNWLVTYRDNTGESLY